MLGKLIKNEFKTVNRLMIPLHLGLILITVIGRFYIQFTLAGSPARYYVRTTNVWYGLVDVMLVMFYIIALLAVTGVTFVYLNIIRFRKNLFSDEGYLMHTLPVSAAEHIWSKVIVNMVWQLADVILVVLSILGLFVNKEFLQAIPEGLHTIFSSFPEAFGVPAGVGIPLYLLLFLLESIMGVLVVYACITIGHSFNEHKLLASVGIYIGVTVVRNLISVIFTGITGIFTGGPFLTISASETVLNFWLTYAFSFIDCIVLGVAAYLSCHYFMTKRLNLE